MLVRNRKKGLVYTLFAIVLAGIYFYMLSIAYIHHGESVESYVFKVKSDELYYFTMDMLVDCERAVEITAKRGLIALVQNVSMSGMPIDSYPGVDNATDALIEVMRHGNLSDSPLPFIQGQSLAEWLDRVRGRVGSTRIDMTVENITITQTGVDTLLVEYNFSFRVHDPITQTMFYRNKVANTTVNITGIEDVLTTVNTSGYYLKTVYKCPFERHAYKAFNDAATNTTFWNGRDVVVGYATFNLDSGDKSEKIFVSNTLPSTAQEWNNLSLFRAFVYNKSSDPSPQMAANGAEMPLAYGSGIATNISEGDILVLLRDNTLVDGWVNNIFKELQMGCYFEIDGGPTMLDRLELSTTRTLEYCSQGFGGMASFMDLSQLPPGLAYTSYSMIDYKYFSGVGKSTTAPKIHGVTEYADWFGLDDDTIDALGIQDLAYD